VLFGNPLCRKYRDHNTCVSDVGRFPQLLTLDGVDRPPLIVADDNEVGVDLSLLSVCNIKEELQTVKFKGSNTSSDQGLRYVYRFLGEYYELHDNNKSYQLMRAYREFRGFR
jgi:hypothetical protein